MFANFFSIKDETDTERERGRSRRAKSRGAFGARRRKVSESESQRCSLLPRSRSRVSDVDEQWTDEDSQENSDAIYDEDDIGDEYEEDDEDEDGQHEAMSLLPIFSANLDAVPVYNIVHTIRNLIMNRVETSLTWDQLKSPQVSQFLVRPILNSIRNDFKSSAGLLYALLANCLQFNKEGQESMNSSARTRSLLAELVAIKLLRDYTTRELIDALSYDFYPLTGASTTQADTGRYPVARPAPRRVDRISTLEIAIRAQSKHFLAHPLVVRQLEAIWAGNIVFHATADSLHRPSQDRSRSNNTTIGGARRSVTLYDPKEASLFKLSRLRVPLYRDILSTCSLTILLALYLSVLITRSPTITKTELVFWFWSAGFMLDEIVGFTETGFALYILSLWNAFDLGILLLLIIFYILRIYGLFVVAVGKHHIVDLSYDILATCAIFLFPRLFSILDHYRYFSQLLIGFRLMFVDLCALFLLIVISCSGFFVAFTLSFARDFYSAKAVAYSLLQMLFGFTPAAWDSWDKYNTLGKFLLTSFLFISHFLIVTILITVLTNSYLRVSANANDEHQFVFAVNTITLVKSDALFSYIAPLNLLAWMLHPLRYVMDFRSFIQLNRTVIKVTHFPMLFMIYFYERAILQIRGLDTAELISKRPGHFPEAPAIGAKVRRNSMMTQQRDEVLDEVFKRPLREAKSVIALQAQQKSKGAVSSWITGIPRTPPKTDCEPSDSNALLSLLSPGRQQVYGTIEEEDRPHIFQRTATGQSGQTTHSDPENFITTKGFHSTSSQESLDTVQRHPTYDEDDDQGDDELFTNDEDEPPEEDIPDSASVVHSESLMPPPRSTMPSSSGRVRMVSPDSIRDPLTRKSTMPRHRQLPRMNTTETILYRPFTKTSPQQPAVIEDTSHEVTPRAKNHRRNDTVEAAKYSPTFDLDSRRTSLSFSNASPGSGRNKGIRAGTETPGATSSSTRKSGRPSTTPKLRPKIPGRSATNVEIGLGTTWQSTPDFAAILAVNNKRARKSGRAMSDAVYSPDDQDEVASYQSFQTKMAIATGNGGGVSDDGILGRLLLARIGAMEEGFRDVARELKGLKKVGTNGKKEQKEMTKSSPALWSGNANI